jgi:hypothetical protein
MRGLVCRLFHRGFSFAGLERGRALARCNRCGLLWSAEPPNLERDGSTHNINPSRHPMTAEAKTPELKPCPFCGARLERADAFSTRTRDCFVHPDLEDQDFCPAGGIRLFSNSPARIANWNARAEPQAPALDLRDKADEAIKDRNAHADHVLRMARECEDGLTALEVIDACWEAFGVPSNRQHLSLSEQVTSTLNELEAAHDEVRALRGALRPFGEAGAHLPPEVEDFKIVAHVPAGPHAGALRRLRDQMTAGDFRRAAELSALRPQDPKGAADGRAQDPEA